MFVPQLLWQLRQQRVHHKVAVIRLCRRICQSVEVVEVKKVPILEAQPVSKPAV
jgi:hypothetical protein